MFVNNWLIFIFDLVRKIMQSNKVAKIRKLKPYNWAVTWDFQKFGMCDQQRLRPACAYVQSDQSLC